ncbi:hypothetical protein LUZ60_016619 [Juncus effusus]|nr:hypothetical protein LUZ60_016619 [Juncus effusus]
MACLKASVAGIGAGRMSTVRSVRKNSLGFGKAVCGGGELRSVRVKCDAGLDVEKKSVALETSLNALEQFKISTDRYMKERSCIGVIGLSVHTAPVEMREKLSIPEAQWPRAIAELCNLNHIEEAAILSTCNRMEVYFVALSWHRAIQELLNWLSKTSGVEVSELRQHLFIQRDTDVTQHLFTVSAGLDSLVLGEGQILAQVKQVVKSGQLNGGLGKTMDRMFKDAITAGKRVRSETNISSGAVSVSSAAVELALMKLLEDSRNGDVSFLLVGAGKMGRLVVKHLESKGIKKVVVVNRSAEKVNTMREEMKDIEIVYRPFDEMLHAASEADVIFTSTASDAPLFYKENVVSLGGMNMRYFIDISVPRNVSECVLSVDNVRVYNVDDLKEVVEANKEDRLRKAKEAEFLINEELKKFNAWRDSLETVPTIKKLRSYADRIRVSELEKCFQKIGDEALNKKVKKAIESLSTSIINRILHGPLQHLRCEDEKDLDETLENMHALNRMFSLHIEKEIIEQKIKSKVDKNIKS